MDKDKLMNYVMAGLAILATMALLASAIFLFFVGSIPTQNKDLLNVVITAQITLVSLVYGWFFGSSKGSEKKTDMLAGATPGGENPQIEEKKTVTTATTTTTTPGAVPEPPKP